MGIFSFLFKHEKSKSNEEIIGKTVADAQDKRTEVLSNQIDPELIAVISAAAVRMLENENPGVYFKITYVSKIWSEVGRQRLMDSWETASKRKEKF